MSDDYCWSCGQRKKNVNGTKGKYHSGICQDCIDDQDAKLKQLNAGFAVGDDWEYKDFSNKTIVVCPQCGEEINLADKMQEAV